MVEAKFVGDPQKFVSFGLSWLMFIAVTGLVNLAAEFESLLYSSSDAQNV